MCGISDTRGTGSDNRGDCAECDNCSENVGPLNKSVSSRIKESIPTISNRSIEWRLCWPYGKDREVTERLLMPAQYFCQREGRRPCVKLLVLTQNHHKECLCQ